MRNKTIAVAVALAVTAGHPAMAAWPDQSGNLPGLISGKRIAITTAALGGAVVGGFILFKKLSHRAPASALQMPAALAFSRGDADVVIQNRGQNAISVSEAVVRGRGFELTKPMKMPIFVSAGTETSIPLRALSPGKAKLQLTYIENGRQYSRTVALRTDN